MNNGPWYKDFFGVDYLSIYSPFLPPERTAREVAGITNLLNLTPGCSILDLCCGHGRHAIPLAKEGYQLTGLDLSETFLQQAQAEAEAQNVSLRLVQSDMQEIPFESEFDAVINIFTSFGYLENEDEDMQVLKQVHKALRPGGTFLLETVNQMRVLRTFSPHGIIRYDDGLIVLEERKIDLFHNRNDIRITMLRPDGRRTEHRQSIRLYNLTDLTRMLANANLQLLAYYGDLDGNPLSMDSRMVVVSRKAE